MLSQLCLFVFFFNDTATTEIYTLSLHDALPIFTLCCFLGHMYHFLLPDARCTPTLLAHSELRKVDPSATRSEEHTSELQSRQYLVCRLLLEKKKTYNFYRSSVYVQLYI